MIELCQCSRERGDELSRQSDLGSQKNSDAVKMASSLVWLECGSWSEVLVMNNKSSLVIFIPATSLVFVGMHTSSSSSSFLSSYMRGFQKLLLFYVRSSNYIPSFYHGRSDASYTQVIGGRYENPILCPLSQLRSKSPGQRYKSRENLRIFSRHSRFIRSPSHGYLLPISPLTLLCWVTSNHRLSTIFPD